MSARRITPRTPLLPVSPAPGEALPPFFLTQFLGAFNDNLFKNALVVLLTFQAASWTTIAPALLANLAAGIFILPFFLFSATAGQLADKYDKARLTRLVKVLEMAIMLVALAGFLLHSLAVLLGALFLLGCHSTLFGPVKYALLPQHLHEDELVGGNALVEAGTFVAILLGTLAGGLLAGARHGDLWIAGGMVVAFAGYLTSRACRRPRRRSPACRSIPTRSPKPGATSASPGRTSRCSWRSSASRGSGSTARCSWPSFRPMPRRARRRRRHGDAAAGHLHGGHRPRLAAVREALRRHVEIGLVPFGSIGLTLFGLDLAFASPAPAGRRTAGRRRGAGQPGSLRVLLALLMLGCSAASSSCRSTR
jgi:MFS family permease